MLESLKKKWQVNTLDLVLILCVFAVTGTTTAWLSRAVPGWVGVTDATPWGWRLSLRLVILLLGYQAVLLAVAALFGQFAFFWRFEKKLWRRLAFWNKRKHNE